MVREMKGTRWAKDVKNLRYLLLRHGDTLDLDELDRLEDLQRSARRLYRAYERKEELIAIFDEQNPSEALPMLKRWLAWAERSRLEHFVKAARTIRKHWDGIAAYFDETAHQWTRRRYQQQNSRHGQKGLRLSLGRRTQGNDLPHCWRSQTETRPTENHRWYDPQIRHKIFFSCVTSRCRSRFDFNAT